MENKNGNGIFLGVVSVATLIVAIIGATFAYFSASTQSEENAVDVGAYEFKLTLSMNQIYPEGVSPSGLIPLRPETVIPGAPEGNDTNLLYALNVARNKCIDDNGLQVCALYQLSIENQATNPVSLSGIIKTTSNTAATVEGEERTGFTNLTYQALVGSHEDNTLKINTEFTKKIKLAEEVDGLSDPIADINIPGATVAEGGKITPGVGTAYILIYLNDEGEDQSKEMGAKYTGQVIYSSGAGVGSQLTGTFRVGGQQESEEPSGEGE